MLLSILLDAFVAILASNLLSPSKAPTALNSTHSLGSYVTSPLVVSFADLEAVQAITRSRRYDKLYIINSTRQGPQNPQPRSLDGWQCKTIYMDEAVQSDATKVSSEADTDSLQCGIRMSSISGLTEGHNELSPKVSG